MQWFLFMEGYGMPVWIGFQGKKRTTMTNMAEFLISFEGDLKENGEHDNVTRQ